MPSCAIPTCKNSVGLIKKQDGITFHLFPADEERKFEWTKIIQRARLDEYWVPTKRSIICSIHFDEKYFYHTKCGLKRLKKEAVPNKLMALASEVSDPLMENAEHSSSSESEIGDVDISELDPVTDSPKVIKLKNELSQKTMRIERLVLRVKTLRQKNRRLVKKNESLKNIIRHNHINIITFNDADDDNNDK